MADAKNTGPLGLEIGATLPGSKLIIRMPLKKRKIHEENRGGR